jgi:hypothetical protein
LPCGSKTLRFSDTYTNAFMGMRSLYGNPG